VKVQPGQQVLINGAGGGVGHFAVQIARLIKPLLISPFVSHNLRRYLSVPCGDDLVVLRDLVEAGKMQPWIERTWQLQEIPQALRHIETGHARGRW
jgi:NADPH:quinone reductase-like Zn-dependent oxidoreductase